MVEEKATLRQRLLVQRQNLSNLLHAQLSEQICQHLLDFLKSHVAAGQLVLAYWSHRQEADLSTLLQLSNYQWGLPRCLPDRQLAWHQWQGGDALVTNRYGLVEPTAAAPLIDITEVSTLLIPAVAIDQQGYRLGYGGGYFDRLLSSEPWPQVMTIGVVFDFAYVPALAVDDWDYPLAAICTESGMVSFPKIAPV
jgi:5-formyltetrahydrofolate cyclo-ligase